MMTRGGKIDGTHTTTSSKTTRHPNCTCGKARISGMYKLSQQNRERDLAARSYSLYGNFKGQNVHWV